MTTHEQRDLTPAERDLLDDRLAAFRDHFECWLEMFSNNWEILDFARHEGTSGPIFDEFEPFVLGEKCVALYGCQWCMINVGDEWHFAISNDSFESPIDITQFNKKKLKRSLSRAWQQRLFKPTSRD